MPGTVQDTRRVTTCLALMLLILAGCQEPGELLDKEQSPGAAGQQQAENNPEGNEPAVMPDPTQPQIPYGEPQQLPGNVHPDEDSLYAVDTTQAEFELTLHGTRNFRLVGRLASPDGKRQIVLLAQGGRTSEVVFDTGWLLPAAGAVNAQGEMLICVNRLVGEPSELTEGNLPDPSHGVDLVCRKRTASGWQKEVPLPRHVTGHWLHDVTAMNDDSFRVSYSGDATGFMVDDPKDGDGMYRVPFREGRFLKPELAAKFRKPTE